MQQYMQQMSGGGGMTGPATDADLYATQEANQSVRGDLPPIPDTGGYTGYGEEMEPMPDPRQTPMPEDAEALATDAIDSAGGWEGTQAPTPTDMERLLEAPTDANCESFDAQFGDGAAAKVIGGDEGGGEPPQGEAEEY